MIRQEIKFYICNICRPSILYKCTKLGQAEQAHLYTSPLPGMGPPPWRGSVSQVPRIPIQLSMDGTVMGEYPFIDREEQF